MNVRPDIAALDFEPHSVHPRESGDPEQLPGHVVWPWVPACAGTNGRGFAFHEAGMIVRPQIVALDFEPYSVHPRESGDPEQLPGRVVWPWVPACAGTNGRGFAFHEAGMIVRPQIVALNFEPYSVHPRGSGDPEQLPGHVVWPWVPACAGTNGGGFAFHEAGMIVRPQIVALDFEPHSVHPRASGDPEHLPGHVVWPWVPACAGMNGRGFAFHEAAA